MNDGTSQPAVVHSKELLSLEKKTCIECDQTSPPKWQDDAFQTGEWSNMNTRDRGKQMFKLADLMEQHKEELATFESLDYGMNT